MTHPWQKLQDLWQPWVKIFDGFASETLSHQALCALKYLRPVLPTVDYHAPVQCMGLQFDNAVGLAAGLDKNGICLPTWAKIGVGSIEIGAVTVQPQAGNERPRLFRLPEYQALINRMGFNNDGMELIADRLQNFRQTYPQSSLRVGVNLGKNKQTPLAKASEDYQSLLTTFWPLADYLCLNISSPNTPDLRHLEEPQYLQTLLEPIFEHTVHLQQKHQFTRPIAIKIDPDQNPEQLQAMMEAISHYAVAAVVATNTTVQRPDGIQKHRHGQQGGGLSGEPLKPYALATVKCIYEPLRQKNIEVIGCGGVMQAADADAFFQAGAKLVQIYTGFIYKGPQLIEDIVRLSASATKN